MVVVRCEGAAKGCANARAGFVDLLHAEVHCLGNGDALPQCVSSHRLDLVLLSAVLFVCRYCSVLSCCSKQCPGEYLEVRLDTNEACASS